ncbi:MAG: flagellar biosynthesis protein FlhA [Planctomycetaceae bacterium]|nr:flagellar biosynthesis protein FlhA [Planctomycetaceae bacterium]
MATFSDVKTFFTGGRLFEFILPVGVAASVFALLVDLPPALLDILLAVNITTGIVILFGTIFVQKPLEMSIFPSILLATTLFRLVLNVATTRLILTRADTEGTEAAGHVIQAFAEFVTGERIVVGIIIFAIIVVIQFVVITKGATRVSEVAARFTLDAMPGRQMAIDADLNAGIIDEKEAQRRRQEITSQADFFGAMDGACKFVRGDAIAGIVITLINVVGGFTIGVLELGMPMADAFQIFTRLTIGDGLVSQVPAFLISLATGMLVTRSSQASNLPQLFISQLLNKPIVLGFAACFLFALLPSGLPMLPLLTLGTSCIGLALILKRKTKKETAAKAEASAAEENKQPEERIEDYLVVDPMELEIGVGIIQIADPNRGGDLLDRIHRIRQNVAADIGIILPRVRIRDSFQIDQLQYRIKIAGMPVALGMVYPDMYMAMDSGVAAGKVMGIETTDPAFNTPAIWIEESVREQAELLGYTVVEPGAVIATHLMETVAKHADELLTRDATQHLLDELKQTSPAAVDEVIPNVLKLSQVQQILQMLLREQTPIRQLGTILEAIGDYGMKTKDPILLTEFTRARLARTLCTKYRDDEDTLHVVMLDPALEDQIRAGFEHSEQGMYIRFSPQAIDQLCKKITPEIEKLTQANLPPIVLVNPQIRAALKQMTSSTLGSLVVLSYNEITRDTKINSVGMVGI